MFIYFIAFIIEGVSIEMDETFWVITTIFIRPNDKDPLTRTIIGKTPWEAVANAKACSKNQMADDNCYDEGINKYLTDTNVIWEGRIRYILWDGICRDHRVKIILERIPCLDMIRGKYGLKDSRREYIGPENASTIALLNTDKVRFNCPYSKELEFHDEEE